MHAFTVPEITQLEFVDAAVLSLWALMSAVSSAVGKKKKRKKN